MSYRTKTKRHVANLLQAAGWKLQCVWGWDWHYDLPMVVQNVTQVLGERLYNTGIDIYNSTCDKVGDSHDQA